MNVWSDVYSKKYHRSSKMEKNTIYCRYYFKKNKKYPLSITPTMVIYVPIIFCEKLNLKDKDRIKIQVHNVNKNCFKIKKFDDLMDGSSYGLSLVSSSGKLHTQFKMQDQINFPISKTFPVASKITNENEIVFDISQIISD